MIMAEIAEGDRVYATETITYPEVTRETCNDGVIEPGFEGTVIELIGHDGIDLVVEWDADFVGGVNSSSVALVPALAR
jgi:hypothetical protein